MKQTVWVLLLGLAALPAWADWACTMPNGRVIYRQMSACPSDAVASREVAAAPATVRPEFKGTFPPPRVTPAQPVPKPTPRPPVPRDLMQEAQAICVLLKADGATSCRVDFNVWSPSVIDATWPASIRSAQRVCLGIANQTRAPGSPFVGLGWELRLFSPFGSGDRPISSCRL